jgi:hypothetical protein
MRRLSNLRTAHPSLSSNSFSKLGDSITASPKFLTCFADPAVHVADAEQTLAAFRSTPELPFSRESQSAENGWSAWQPLAGNPSPLLAELSATQGRFALLMLGTNDIETSRVTTFGRRLIKLVDALLAHGVVPIISTIPERRDREASRLKVPRFNVVIRAVAQLRQVPLVDLHYALGALPNEGLSSDGIHPNVYRASGVVRACEFSAPGLRHGFNVRNLETLRALDRARKAVTGAMTPEPNVPRFVQRAPGELEWRVTGLPTIDMPGRQSEAAPFGPCWSTPNVPGQQSQSRAIVHYRFVLKRSMPLEVLAVEAGAGASLRFGIQRVDTTQCLANGHGFRRSLLPRGHYSLTVEASQTGVLVALLQGRSSAS